MFIAPDGGADFAAVGGVDMRARTVFVP